MNEPKTQSPTAEEAAPDGILVWACPNCGGTYHSSAVGDLSTFPNIRTAMRNSATETPANWGSVTGYRNDCQMCKDSREAQAHGGPFQRERVIYVKASAVRQES